MITSGGDRPEWLAEIGKLLRGLNLGNEDAEGTACALAGKFNFINACDASETGAGGDAGLGNLEKVLLLRSNDHVK